MRFDAEGIKTALDRGDGCRVIGAFEVMRVPGNFHISSHAYGEVVKEMMVMYGEVKVNMTHTVNHLAFGEEKELKDVEKGFRGVGNLYALDGVVMKDEGDGMMFEYYLNVVPTIYEGLDAREMKVHQFTYHSSKTQSGLMIPTIYFRYDISPILVKYAMEKPGRFGVFVNVCAVLGGLVTIAGMVHSLLLKLLKKRNKHL